MSNMIYLAEITCAVDAVGTLATLYFGSGGYTTGPNETPASTYYEPRLLQPANFIRPMFSDVTTSGKSTVTYGTMDLSNSDGGLDYLLGYGFDNRVVRVLVGDPSQPYTTFTVALRGTIQTAQFSYKTLSFTLRDRQAELDLLLCRNRYGGTNVLPAGKDGAADIAGKPIPRLYGTALNITPVLCNTSKLIYQVHDGAIHDILNVYDSGLALTRGADYATLADVEVTPPGAGQYRVCQAGGYFRLGSSPAGQLTCDAQNGATAANRTCAQIMKQLALDMGISSQDISMSDVAALDALNSAECGVVVQDESTGLAVMDLIAPCTGAYFGFDRLGVFRMAQLNAPGGVPVLSIDTSQITDIDIVASNDANNGIPAYLVNVAYAKNYTQQTSGLAGAVTDARKLLLAQASQTTSAQDASVKLKHLAAPVMQRDTLLIASSDAYNEALRLLTIFKVVRNTFQVKIKLDAASIAAIDLGVVVRVTCNRFGMNGGTLLRVIGIEGDYATNSAVLTLWA